MSRRSLLNYIGLCILIAGMASGELIYWRSLHAPPAAAEDGESPYDSRAYQQEVLRTIGVFGSVMDQWDRSLATLREPRKLAVIIVIVSLLASGACFYTASRQRSP